MDGNSWSVITDFESGGGRVTLLQSHPAIVRVIPHNEGDGGWSQVWWYFKVSGFTPGQEVRIELDRQYPVALGINRNIFFSYDQSVWGIADTGKDERIDDRDFVVYRHIVRSGEVWFAYNLPYSQTHVEALLLPQVRNRKSVERFTLCETLNGRVVHGLRFDEKGGGGGRKYGIWLQARCHAFESGASWVLHEIALWLLSNEPLAKELLSVAVVHVIPIVDVDGVVEGRTGKYQKPYDPWMNWHVEQHYWPQIRAVKQSLLMLSNEKRCDLFIDLHGPGGASHPYFIVPLSEQLPHQSQRKNRERFFEVLKARPFNDDAKKTQSMTNIHYSPRPLNEHEPNSGEWVSLNTSEQCIAMTIEVNMNTHLSTHDGYRAEAKVLGEAMSRYFVEGHHLKTG